MRIEQLQQILEIHKHKSISKAAKNLFVSQPSLSTALSSFEDEVQVTVFERTHSGVVATPEGEEILVLIENAVAALDQIRYYNCSKKDYSGEVHLLYTPAYGFMTYKLTRAMKALYPKVQLILDERPIDELLVAMQNGVAFLGVLTWGVFFEQTEELLHSLGLSFRKMNRRTLMAYLSADHPLANKDELDQDDLAQGPFISYSSAFWKRIEEGIGVHCDALILRDTEDIRKGVYRGQQIALLPDLFAIDDVYCEQGLIKLVSVAGQTKMEGYDCLVYPTKKALSALEKDILKIMEDILSEG